MALQSLIKNAKKVKWGWQSIWFLFLFIFCFIAFGEEISWGQHIWGFESPELLQKINKQQETNIHN